MISSSCSCVRERVWIHICACLCRCVLISSACSCVSECVWIHICACLCRCVLISSACSCVRECVWVHICACLLRCVCENMQGTQALGENSVLVLLYEVIYVHAFMCVWARVCVCESVCMRNIYKTNVYMYRHACVNDSKYLKNATGPHNFVTAPPPPNEPIPSQLTT